MAQAQRQCKPMNARRFAGLFAGSDTNNASEEEALAKFRLLRRMTGEAGMRIVDALELPDVRQAVDAQLQPLRAESPELREALERVDTLGLELTERTRDVCRLAESLKRSEETVEGQRAELAKLAQQLRTQEQTTEALRRDLAKLSVWSKRLHDLWAWKPSRWAILALNVIVYVLCWLIGLGLGVMRDWIGGHL